MERRWITANEAAIYLCLHVKTIYSKISRGEIPASKIGGSVRIDKKRLDQLMEDREQMIEDLGETIGIK